MGRWSPKVSDGPSSLEANGEPMQEYRHINWLRIYYMNGKGEKCKFNIYSYN